ncbi:hypothetical protein L484_017926 [Morus notabilis]|uniref:Uncharacterized protein n=1 Tax=Morus notabilis TaxID=981085 RepID=W9RJR8_9ROSA|nr:hypothetical protein L484_017926 [Morus notabilis]
MQPNTAHVNLTESKTIELTISLMMDSDSDNSSKVSSHVSADERRASKKKISGRETVAVISFPNNGWSNMLTSDPTPSGHGPGARTTDVDSSSTGSANTNHMNITKHSSTDTGCSEVATPDIEGS